MNKLRMFLSIIAISSALMNVPVVANSGLDPDGFDLLKFTARLTAFATSCSGLGYICHYKAGSPRYNIYPYSEDSWFHNHGSYPTEYHGKYSDATLKQKRFSRAASLLLKTGSTLKRPCGLLWFTIYVLLAGHS